MSETPAFFIPFADTAEQAETVYASIRAFMAKVAFRPNDRRIYQIAYRHNGKDYVATVGEEGPENEPVIAILETFNPGPLYMICSPNRGVVRGEPFLAGNVQSVTNFS